MKYTTEEKIVREHWMPDTEQFGHLEYMASYTVDGVRYLFHKKSMMILVVVLTSEPSPE